MRSEHDLAQSYTMTMACILEVLVVNHMETDLGVILEYDLTKIYANEIVSAEITCGYTVRPITE